MRSAAGWWSSRMIFGKVFFLLLLVLKLSVVRKSAGEVLIMRQVARQNCQGHHGV